MSRRSDRKCDPVRPRAVSGDAFSFEPADIGSTCTAANYCGFNALFSEWNSGFEDWNGSDDSFPAQDAGSTYTG